LEKHFTQRTRGWHFELRLGSVRDENFGDSIQVFKGNIFFNEDKYFML